MGEGRAAPPRPLTSVVTVVSKVVSMVLQRGRIQGERIGFLFGQQASWTPNPAICDDKQHSP